MTSNRTPPEIIQAQEAPRPIPGRKTRSVTRKAVIRVDIRNAVFRAVPSLSRAEALAIVDEFFDQIAEILAQGENLSIRRVGQFVVRTKPARPARDPRNGAPAMVSARRVVRFKPSRTFTQRINRKDAAE